MNSKATLIRAAVVLAAIDPEPLARAAGVDHCKVIDALAPGGEGRGLTEADRAALLGALQSYGVEAIVLDDGRACVFELPSDGTPRKAACSEWAIRLLASGSSLEGRISEAGQRHKPGSSMGVHL